jgi:hypothetical protein
MKAIADPRDGEVVGMIARPLAQMLVQATAPLDDITFVLHTKGRAISESVIRAALARADSRLAAYNVVSLTDAAAQSRTTERFIFVLVSAFGLLGLILAAVGLYGLLSLQVARRQREFGFAVPWEQQRDKSFNSSRIKARVCLRSGSPSALL